MRKTDRTRHIASRSLSGVAGGRTQNDREEYAAAGLRAGGGGHDDEEIPGGGAAAEGAFLLMCAEMTEMAWQGER